MLLTHRDEVRSIVLLTGDSTGGVTPYDWTALAKPGTAYAFYMAVGAAPRIQANLLSVGMPADTPVALVENGCSPTARTVHATLASLARAIQDNKISNPAMLFVRYGSAGGGAGDIRQAFGCRAHRGAAVGSVDAVKRNDNAGLKFIRRRRRRIS